MNELPYTVALFDEDGNETYLTFGDEWVTKVYRHWKTNTGMSGDIALTLLRSYFPKYRMRRYYDQRGRGCVEYILNGVKIELAEESRSSLLRVKDLESGRLLLAMPNFDAGLLSYVVVLYVIMEADFDRFRQQLISEAYSASEHGKTDPADLDRRMVYCDEWYCLVPDAMLRRAEQEVTSATSFFENLAGTAKFETIYGKWFGFRGWQVACDAEPLHVVDLGNVSPPSRRCRHHIVPSDSFLETPLLAAQSREMAFYLTGLYLVSGCDFDIFCDTLCLEME